MKAIKNLSVKWKISTIIILAVIMSAIVTVALFEEVKSVRDESASIFYEQLYGGGAALINADRDLYQAYVAEILHAYGKDTDLERDVKEYIADFEENAQQILDYYFHALLNLRQTKASFISDVMYRDEWDQLYFKNAAVAY